MWNSMHGDRPKASDAKEEDAVADGDLVGNFVRRTDNEFRGFSDPRLIGRDIGDDEEDEDEK